MEIGQDDESGDGLGIAGLDGHGLVFEGSARQPGTVRRNRKTATEAGSSAVGGRARQKGYPAWQNAVLGTFLILMKCCDIDKDIFSRGCKAMPRQAMMLRIERNLFSEWMTGVVAGLFLRLGGLLLAGW